MKQLDSNIIIIGDMHLGIKKFSTDVLRSQIKLFTDQIIPYMKKNNIKQIFQLGDIFDNRTSVNVIWFETLKREFFDVLEREEIELFTLKGNHDISFREKRDVALIDTISEIYDNVTVFGEREYIKVGEQDVYIVPWITKNEKLTKEEIKDVDYIFGHFEIRNFSMVRGIVDTSSELTEDFFKKDTKLNGVFSGHYHLRNIKGFVKYLGSAFQLNWNDYNDIKGFYDFDGFKLDFIENITTKKHIKVKYNDSENTDRNIEISGLYEFPKLVTNTEFDGLLPELNKHEVKTFINKHKDDAYEEMIYKMKKADITTTVVNNQELSELINIDYIQDDKSLDQKDTKTLIRDTLNSTKPELIPLLNELLAEIDSENIEG